MRIANCLVGLSLLCLILPVAAQEEKKPVQDEVEAPKIVPPESWTERMRRERTVLELTPKDAMRLALTNNLDIAIEDYNEDLNLQDIVRTKGFYDPRLSFSVGINSNENPARSVLDAGQGISVNTTDNFFFSSSVGQNFPGGSDLTVTFNNNRFSTNSAFQFINPSFGSNFDLLFRQPLWRGFRRTSTETQLSLHNLDRDISDSVFKQRVSEILQQVQNQYWELVFAIENHEAIRESMKLAIIQHENNRKRVQIGVMAPIEVTASRAEVATREQDMIQSEVQIITSQNALKQLLAPDPKASIWNLILIPTKRPEIQDLSLSLDQAIEIALQRRPELEQNRLERDKIEVNRKYYIKEGKPAVNLEAGIISRGNTGRVLQNVFVDTDGDGVPDTRSGTAPDPDSPFFGNFGNTWGQVFGFDFINYQVSLSVEIPIGNRANEGERALLRIQERRLLSMLRNEQQLIMVEVRNAYESIATQRKRLEAARVARELSEEQLEGENKRFQAGLSTNFEVLRYQRDLTDAQVRELRALVDYQQTLTDLEKAMYTIIDANDIVMARREGNAP